jgi:hypothetical protein
MKLILETLERARLAASPAEADALRVALIDVEALADALTRNGYALDDAPAALAPNGLLDAVEALYLACGDEDSEQADAIAALPGDLNAALADVIRYGAAQ